MTTPTPLDITAQIATNLEMIAGTFPSNSAILEQVSDLAARLEVLVNIIQTDAVPARQPLYQPGDRVTIGGDPVTVLSWSLAKSGIVYDLDWLTQTADGRPVKFKLSGVQERQLSPAKEGER